MNICMFTNTYLPHVGGVARSVSSFEEDLRKLGHNVLIVAPTFSGLSEEDAGLESERVLRVPAIQNFNGSDFSVRIPIPFLIDEKIDEFKPDIIHSHHPFLLGDAALRAAHRRLLPIVFTHHTRYEEYTHYVSASSEAMRRFVVNLSTAYANYCTYVVAPSQSIADLIKRRGVTTPIAEIPTGIDFETFQTGESRSFRQNHDIPEDVDLIGHLGRLTPEKNLEYLTAAVKIYLKKNEKARFLIVGSGPSMEDIEQDLHQAGLADRVILAGKKTGKELMDAYAAMDLFVFSSQSETQGLVVVEAMAANTPVVALDASGVREVVADGENGRLLAADAPVESFAEAIEAFFSNPDRARTWQRNARETAREFDRIKCARKLSGLYEQARQLAPKTQEEYTHISGYLENLIQALRTEWDLLSEKFTAVAQSFQADEKELDSESSAVPEQPGKS